MSASNASLTDVSGEHLDAADKPPLRRLAIMAAVAAVLAIVAAVLVLPRLAPPVPTQSGVRFLDLDPKRVRQVDVLRPDGTTYAFARKDRTWFLVRDHEEIEVPSDRLDGFLETLAGLTRLVVIDEPGVNPAEFGFAPPRAMVTIRDGRSVSFAIGDRNPTLTALYVRIAPNPNIILVGSVLLWEFDKLVALSKSQPVEPREPTGAVESR